MAQSWLTFHIGWLAAQADGGATRSEKHILFFEAGQGNIMKLLEYAPWPREWIQSVGAVLVLMQLTDFDFRGARRCDII